MKTFNKIELLGNVGNEVQIEEKEEVSYVRMNVAENYKPKEGEQITQWHNVVAFNGLAKIIGEKVKKGTTILVHGRLDQSTYTDKEGIERTSYSIIANDVVIF